MNKQEKLNNGATYRTVGEYRGVLVKIPKQSDFMRWSEGGYPVASVPAHWAHGKPFERRDKALTETPIILNCNFYGLSDNDLGRRIVADIEAIHKTTDSGDVYLMLDIKKTSGEASWEMEFHPIAGISLKLSSGVSSIMGILGSNFCVAIVQLPERKSAAA